MTERREKVRPGGSRSTRKGGFELCQEGGHKRVRIVGASLHGECLDRQVTAVTALAHDTDETVQIDADRARLAEGTFLDLKIDGVGNHLGDIDIGSGVMK